MDEVTFSLENSQISARLFDIELDQLNLDYSGYVQQKSLLSISIDQLKGLDSLEALLPHDLAALGLELEFSPALPRYPRRSSLQQWREQGGQIEITASEAAFEGMQVRVTGRISFDKEQKYQGFVTLTLINADRFVDYIESKQKLSFIEKLSLQAALTAYGGQDAQGRQIATITQQFDDQTRDFLAQLMP